jgi:hypothetical protein
MQTTNSIKQVTVVIREVDGDETIYVDGLFREYEGVYACDIHRIADGEPIFYRHILTESEFDEWPGTLAELGIE